MRLLLAAALLCLSTAAQAGSATLSWTAPTQRTDGTPLVELSGYRIYHGCSESGEYPNVIAIDDPSATTYVVSDLPDTGTCYFVATSVDTGGLESVWSNEASKDMEGGPVVFPDPPMPPADLTVQEGEQTAYTLAQSENRLALVPVGNLPAGVACDSSQRLTDSNGITAYVVPIDAVQWAGSVESQVAFAQCSAG